MVVTQTESPYYVARPLKRDWDTGLPGGFPFLPEPPDFRVGPYPNCNNDWLGIADPVAKVQATNACKRSFSSYKINWLNEYRKAMNAYATTLGEIYTKEVAPNFLSREPERNEFYREMTKRVEGVRDGGYLMANYESLIARFEQDFKGVVDSYNRASGCAGYPTPAGLAPNQNC